MKSFKTIVVTAAVSSALILGATAASAATFVYDLSDHPSGSNSDAPHNHDYGLRLDAYKSDDDKERHFSFDGASTATLSYNDVTQTASITGTMMESIYGLGVTADSETWDIEYTISGVTNIGAIGSGFFQDFTGSGSGKISMGTFGSADYIELSLGAKNMGTGTPYFILNQDGHRTGDANDIVGRGWVNPKDDNGAYVMSTNDFLFVADLQGGGDGGDDDMPAVPLPAAAWMLMAGIGGLGGLRRFGKKKS